jgi:hypothetical protein
MSPAFKFISRQFSLANSLTIVLASMGALAATSQAAQSYSYQIRIPDRGQSCEAEASNLAQKFAHLAQVQVTGSSCLSSTTVVEDSGSYILHSVLVNYDAARPLRPYSAYIGRGDMFQNPGNIVGLYSDLGSCLGEIKAESDIFTRATGLEVLAATCEPGTLGLGGDYVLHIDGVGQPAQRLYAFSPSYPGQALSPFSAELKDLLTQSGSTLAKLVDTDLLYYAKASLNLKLDYAGSFSDESQCQSQLADARQIYLNAHDSWVKTKCSSEEIGQDTGVFLHTLNVLHMGDMMVISDFGENSIHYLTFDECRKDRERVLNSLTAHGQNIYGGICRTSMGGDQYVLEVYSPI